MKKINITYILSLSILVIIGCSSGGDDGTPPPKEENKAPEAVSSLFFPTNNLLCSTNTLEFSWGATTDPNGDNVSYILEISKDEQFTSNTQTLSSSATTRIVSLEKGVIYYWRVKSIDSKGLESDYSSVFQFYTEGNPEVNHIPFPAQAISPTDRGTVSSASTTLQWNTTDVDNDPITYDVYFGTATDPTTKVGNNQNEKTLNVDLNATTTYYWKVVAKDDKGGQAIGRVWSFSTE